MIDLQRTLVLVKPDAVRRRLVGVILARFEAKGLAIDALDLRQIDAAMADRHYREHLTQPWYPELREFMTSGPLIAAALSGPRAVEVVRLMIGSTAAATASPGTIRGDLSLNHRENLVHASDSLATAAAELALWFPGRF